MGRLSKLDQDRLVILPLALLFVAAIAVWKAQADGADLLRQWRSADFPVAAGTIITKTTGAESRHNGSSFIDVPVPKVEYTYVVDGASRNGSRIAFFRGAVSDEDTMKWVHELSVGDEVDVYYDPDDASHAALINGRLITPAAALFTGGMYAGLIALCVGCMAWWARLITRAMKK